MCALRRLRLYTMAASAGLPLSLAYDENYSILLSDSEDEDDLPIGSSRNRNSHMDAMQRKTEEAAANVPLHPIPAMQPAFAESLIEATNTSAAPKPKLRFGDAKERRTRLLDGDETTKLHAELWRYRPGQKHHELWKLMAQISFGVYLLLNGIANSNEQVVSILQDHIDEVDEFLEVALEDVRTAIEDVSERTDLLKLPMSNMDAFEKMLEDRAFRLQIVTGNEKIDHIITRTRTALDATMEDIDEGMRATAEFDVYLGNQMNQPWRQQRPDVVEIFEAMKGNAEGWWKAFNDLQESASDLDTLLTALGQMTTEMDQRAGEVSRRTRVGATRLCNASPPFGTRTDLPQFSVTPFTDPFSEPSDTHRSKENSTKSALASVRSSAAMRPTRSNTQSSQHSYNSERSGRESLPVFLAPPESEDEDNRQQNSRASKLGQITEAGHEEEEQLADETLFILQPRTYTPKPPEPLPSPMVHDDAEPYRNDVREESDSESEPEPEPIPEPVPDPEPQLPKRSSLRQRVSLKGGNPPGRIQVPSRQGAEITEVRQVQQVQQIHQVPRAGSTRAPSSSHGHNSSYGSSIEARAPPRPTASPYGDFVPPAVPNTIPSPLSDQQYFRPVQASPHSPLQQRPWTSAAMQHPPNQFQQNQYRGPHYNQQGRPGSPYASSQHSRNQQSRMGMSTLSNVTTMHHDGRPGADDGGKKAKKKRSAFGWLRKAFTLDDEERAEFEARRNQQLHNPYYDHRSPKYLDGKRIDDYRRR